MVSFLFDVWFRLYQLNNLAISLKFNDSKEASPNSYILFG